MAAIRLYNTRHAVRLVFAFYLLFIVTPHMRSTDSVCTGYWTDMYNPLEPFSVCSAGRNTSETIVPWSGRGTMTQDICAFSVHPAFCSMSLLLCGDVESNPGPDTMCIAECKHKRKAAGDMIRCCLCACWFHEDCVGITSESERGVWPCPDCRLLSSRVSSLTAAVNKLTEIAENLSTKLNEMETTRSEDTRRLMEKTELLVSGNTELKAQVGDVNGVAKTIAENTAKLQAAPTEDKEPPCLVIGDSMVKDLAESKLENTRVIYKRDGRITDVAEKVRNLQHRQKSITLVVGVNDCSGNECQATDIVESYGRLMDVAKEKAQQVTVSSIPPRLNTDAMEKIRAVNAGLVATCRDRGVTYADNDPYFTFPDGSVNEGYVESDGIHLTRSGLNRLARTTRLQMKDANVGVEGRYSQPTQSRTSPISAKACGKRLRTPEMSAVIIAGNGVISGTYVDMRANSSVIPAKGMVTKPSSVAATRRMAKKKSPKIGTMIATAVLTPMVYMYCPKVMTLKLIPIETQTV